MDDNPFLIMSLDGGGAKGVYTLGVLNELEQYWGEPLFSRFDLIYGTSTGAIIAALLAAGKTVPEVERLYFDLVPRVMRYKSRAKRTSELKAVAAEIFGDQTFDSFKTGVGIVATNYDSERPMIFKADGPRRLPSVLRLNRGSDVRSPKQCLQARLRSLFSSARLSLHRTRVIP